MRDRFFRLGSSAIQIHGDFHMKKLLFAGTAAAALLVAGAAYAAEVALTISPEHRTFVKEYVVKQRVSPITVSGSVAVGTPLPAGVVVQPVPEALYMQVPEVREYDYFYWNGRVVFVDRHSKQVVQIIE
jgi:Protein of unknown function (DUF1236)